MGAIIYFGPLIFGAIILTSMRIVEPWLAIIVTILMIVWAIGFPCIS